MSHLFDFKCEINLFLSPLPPKKKFAFFRNFLFLNFIQATQIRAFFRLVFFFFCTPHICTFLIFVNPQKFALRNSCILEFYFNSAS